MSIIIHIPKISTDKSFQSKEHQTNEDSNNIDEYNDTVSINLPKFKQAKSNDLSKLEVSVASSKYTLSGDDMVSNLSFESNFYLQAVTNSFHIHNEVEKEIEIDGKNIRYITTPVKKKSTSDFSYKYQETNTGHYFSSERVIYEEFNRAQMMTERNDNKNNLSNLSNIIAEKSNFYNLAYNNQISPRGESNFIYQVIKRADREDTSKKPKLLNKGFIMDEDNKKNEERINKLNEKLSSMIKIQDNQSKHSDSGYSSHSTSVKLTCFQKVCTSKKSAE